MWSPKLIANKQPIYQQLADAMAKAIEQGDLKVGDKLPPQRKLAWQLNINVSTVTKAFHLATQRHLISGEVGRGTYVLAQSSEAKLYQLKNSYNAEHIDLSTHVPAYNTNSDDLAKTLSVILTEKNTFSHYSQYLPPHAIQRIQLCGQKWLQQLHYPIEPQYCVATTTAQNALLTTLLACTNKDDVILVGEFSFPSIRTIAKQLHLKLHGIKMDEQGIKPESLDLAIRTTGSTILVSDPTMQNPTASNMSMQRKQEIAEIIKRHQLLFIEEFVIGMLSNEAPLSNTIKENAILITSFAKAINPGIRFALIAGKHPIIKQLINDHHATTWQLSPLMAEVACQWIESGISSHRLQWQQLEIEKRFRLFKKQFPSAIFPGNPVSSPHVWLATNKNSEVAALELHKLGVEVVPAKFFAVSHQFPHFIRVSLTAATSHQQLKIALETIYNANVILKKNAQN
ncbi:PLP-dependent aminotransferase family protein [Colwelliaceae bacterium 6441]